MELKDLWKTTEPPKDESWIDAVNTDGVITTIQWEKGVSYASIGYDKEGEWFIEPGWYVKGGGRYLGKIVAWSPS